MYVQHRVGSPSPPYLASFYLAHPDVHYFAVSKIGEDQMQDWALRAGFSEAEAKRWLAQIL